MNDARRGPTLTTLRDGRVLAIGGVPNSGTAVSASTEVYDPRTGWWSRSGALRTPGLDYTATLLSDGRVIVIGGFDINSTHGPLESTEVYDPATGVWCTGASMGVPRYLHSAVALKDGRVLVVGGANAGGSGDGILASAEIYDPSTRSFTPAHPMHHPRYGAAATALPDGTVLVTGGGSTISTMMSTEIYDPLHDIWTDGPDMSAARWRHTATLVSVPVHGSQSLPLTEVVVTGGTWVPNTDVYDVASHMWRRAADLPEVLQSDTVTALADGRVLVAGGVAPGAVVNSTEIFQPLTGEWSAAAPMSVGRCDHAAALLSDGRVVVAGGWGPSADGTSFQTMSSSELFTP
jgi:N-acetylneuraminic acid mutarotase